ncbi:ComF family protein [Soehngenia saccharolytica]|nr:ComF family protein [Soehngenia saccharolytica]
MIDKFLFPTENVCSFCKDYDENLIYGLCEECRDRIEELHAKVNLKTDFVDDLYVSIFYNRFAKDFIHQYKFNNKSYLFKTFSSYMNKTLCKLEIFDYDLIIPVPIHRRKEAIRGYNQSYLLANEIAKYNKKPIYKDVLIKRKWTKEQNKLNLYERRLNLSSSFIVKREKIILDKKILLIDDIVTTGMTLELCSKELKENGADKIIGLCLSTPIR